MLSFLLHVGDDIKFIFCFSSLQICAPFQYVTVSNCWKMCISARLSVNVCKTFGSSTHKGWMLCSKAERFAPCQLSLLFSTHVLRFCCPQKGETSALYALYSTGEQEIVPISSFMVRYIKAWKLQKCLRVLDIHMKTEKVEFQSAFVGLFFTYI